MKDMLIRLYVLLFAKLVQFSWAPHGDWRRLPSDTSCPCGTPSSSETQKLKSRTAVVASRQPAADLERKSAHLEWERATSLLTRVPASTYYSYPLEPTAHMRLFCA